MIPDASSDSGRSSSAVRFAVDAAALAMLVALLLIVAHFASRPLGNGDHFWQVRTGERILDTRSFVTTDDYSYTIAGAPWNNHQWGYEVLAALLFRAFGWGGFRVWITLLLVGLCIGLFAVVRRRSETAVALLVTVLLFQLAYYKFNPACQTLSMVLFFLAFHFFRGERIFSSWKWAAALWVTLLVWGNLTAEVVVFLPFLAAELLFHLVEGREREATGRIRAVAVVLVACVLPLLNPPGSSVLDYATQGSMVNSVVNSEFRNLFEPAGTLPAWSKDVARALAVLFVAHAGVVLLRSGNRLRALRGLTAGLGCVAGALLFERNLWMLVIPAAMIGVRLTRGETYRRHAPAFDSGLLVLAGVLVVPHLASVGWSPAIALRQVLAPRYHERQLDSDTVPLACVAYVRQRRPGTHVFAPRLWGNVLIWGAPKSRVFIDGRNREYPPEVHTAATLIERAAPPAARLLDASGTDLVLAGPGWNARDEVLKRTWGVEMTGPNCVVFGRVNPAPAATPDP